MDENNAPLNEELRYTESIEPPQSPTEKMGSAFFRPAESLLMSEEESPVEMSESEDIAADDADTEPIAVEDIEEIEAEPIVAEAIEEVEAEPIEEEAIEEVEAEPIAVEAIEEVEAEPIAVEAIEEVEAEPIAVEAIEEIEAEPIVEEAIEEIEAEPIAVEAIEEVEAEPIAVEAIEEVEAEPIAVEAIEEVEAEPIAIEAIEEIEAEPIAEEAIEEIEAEPIVEEAIEEIEAEPTDEESDDPPTTVPIFDLQAPSDFEQDDEMDAPTREYFENSLDELAEEQNAMTDSPDGQVEPQPTHAEVSPMELFTPVIAPSAKDPLSDKESLPTLFPQQKKAEQPAPIESEEPVNPTLVPRKQKKKRTIWRILRRVFVSLIKWALALVLAAAILAGALLGYLTVTEYNPDYAEKAQSGSKQISTVYQSTMPLRIVTFNTGYGGLGKDADFFMDGGEGVTPQSEEYIKSNMIGIERVLRGIDADVIFLQEVDTDSKRSYGLNQWLQYEYDLQEYESRFALNYSCDYVPYPISTDMIGKVHSGVATYSRFDITSATRYSLPCPFSWPTRVANLKRCLLVTRIQIDDLAVTVEEKSTGPQLVLINFHLDAYDDGEGRAAQFQQLMQLMKEEYAKGNYVIAGGDFNQTFPNCDTYPIINDEHFKPGTLPLLSSGWKYQYDDSSPTSRLLNEPYDPTSEATQYYIIDGFIVSPNVKVKNVHTWGQGFAYSDHNPVVMDIELN